MLEKCGGLRTQLKIKKSQLTKPLVTIITAVYNGAEFLESTIKSILSQTYDNIEYIVIDGGSKDGTLAILEKYTEQIDYWVSEPDGGISDAFNKGITLARGDYINFQGDGDGLYSKNIIMQLFSNISYPFPMLVCGRIQRISTEGNEIYISKYTSKFHKSSLLFRMSLPHQALFTHKDMFSKYGIFDVKNTFCMDYEHLLRAYHDFPLVRVEDVVVARWRADGLGNGRTLEVFKEYDFIKRKHKIAPSLLLSLINYWILFKYKAKQILLFLGKNGTN